MPVRHGQHVIAAIVLALVGLFAVAVPATAQTVETEAPNAILMDFRTGTVLFEKNAADPVPPASMSKLMTMEVVFNALEEGRLKLDDEFFISENAWRNGGAPSGGSTMFAEINSSIKLVDLIQGVIVQSANDASIAIAEGMAGSEEAFAQMMAERAAAIGLTDSTFVNSTGLPDPGHRMSVRDLARLARHIIAAYPEFYRYYSQAEFTWNDILQRNRNPLLRSVTGADGLKTGYTSEAGYGLVGSAVRADQRLIVVVAGLERAKTREEEARKLIDWGFRTFEQVRLFEAGEEVGTARVYGGQTWSVPLVGDGAITILLPRGQRRKLRADIQYRGPLLAPVREGTRVASLKVTTEEGVSLSVPLYAGQDVARGPLHRRAMDATLDLLTRWW